jgi:arabinogalactan endo-1,4-beta-galactosidase
MVLYSFFIRKYLIINKLQYSSLIIHHYLDMLRFFVLLQFFTFIACTSCKKMNIEKPVLNKPQGVYYSPDKFVMGSDLSYVNQLEDYGGVFKDSGNVKDVFKLLKARGNNLVRVRLWHSPTWTTALNNGKQYSDLQDVVKTIRRAKAEGMHVNLDLHYSDTWADPANQTLPKAWEGLPLSILKDSVYNYTLKTLQYLQNLNLTPEMIQIGNENNNGMLFPLGKISNNNFTAFAELLKSGCKAVRDFSLTSVLKPQIIIHCAQLQNAEWWADGVVKKGGVTDFDILGLSHYYKWSTVNDLLSITNTINKLKMQYGKKIMIVETAFSWTTESSDNYNNIMWSADAVSGYPISQEGQQKYMRDFTQAVITGGGSGVQYWEPCWITTNMKDLWGKGSSWENNTLFDFKGNALPALDYMSQSYQF